MQSPVRRPTPAKPVSTDLVVPYPEAIAGTPGAYSFDRAQSVMHLSYSTKPVAPHLLCPGAVTEVFEPRSRVSPRLPCSSHWSQGRVSTNLAVDRAGNVARLSIGDGHRKSSLGLKDSDSHHRGRPPKPYTSLCSQDALRARSHSLLSGVGRSGHLHTPPRSPHHSGSTVVPMATPFLRIRLTSMRP